MTLKKINSLIKEISSDNNYYRKNEVLKWIYFNSLLLLPMIVFFHFSLFYLHFIIRLTPAAFITTVFVSYSAYLVTAFFLTGFILKKIDKYITPKLSKIKLLNDFRKAELDYLKSKKKITWIILFLFFWKLFYSLFDVSKSNILDLSSTYIFTKTYYAEIPFPLKKEITFCLILLSIGTSIFFTDIVLLIASKLNSIINFKHNKLQEELNEEENIYE